MSLIINGITIPTDKELFLGSGKPVHRVIANGVVVWKLDSTPALPGVQELNITLLS